MIITTFYKVIVLDIDIFDSSIVEERHFGSKAEAHNFKEYINNTTDYIGVMVQL